jgi:hypothetical protein
MDQRDAGVEVSSRARAIPEAEVPYEPADEALTERYLLALVVRLDPFQTFGAPCFEPPATDEDWEFLFGNDPEEEYQP